MAKSADDFIWIEFSGLVVGEDRQRIQFRGDSEAGGMEPFWISRKGVRLILYSNNTWSDKPQRGKGVVWIYMAAWAARQVGLA